MERYSALISRKQPTSGVREVLLTREEAQWHLPEFIPGEEIHNTNPLAANQVIREQIGVRVTTRYALRIPNKPCPLNIYVTELRTPLPAEVYQKQGSWHRYETLEGLAFTFPEEKNVVEWWFAEFREERLPELDIPWWQEGWFEEAAHWLETQVIHRGNQLVAPVEQLRCAYTAAILRAGSQKGNLYMKAIPSLFAHEIPLTQILAEQYPTYSAPLLATQGLWMLMEEMQGSPPGLDTPMPRWEDILKFYSQMQIQSISEADNLLSLGCIDIRTERLATHLEEIVTQAMARLRGLPQRLSESEEAQIRAILPHLQEQCFRLLEAGIPDTLEHGDLHAGNILMTESNFRIFDWSHACVTCPFYGFGSLLLDDDWFPGQPEKMTHLREVYLEPWTTNRTLEQLIVAFELWKSLRPLFQIAHQSHIVGIYQQMLDGQDYIPETAAGNSLQHMQWWLSADLRNLLPSPGAG